MFKEALGGTITYVVAFQIKQVPYKETDVYQL